MNRSTCIRLLALDLHPLRFGFVMFEGPDELLDWGIKASRHGGEPVKVSLNVKLASLLEWYVPDFVVIKIPTTAPLKRRIRTIAVLAKNRRIPVRLISSSSVRKAFPGNNQNKYQVATVIAARHPELSPRLGPRRKLWEAEKHSMGIFDAAAIGIAYFTREATINNSSDGAFSSLPR
jgi:hypothetical protein